MKYLLIAALALSFLTNPNPSYGQDCSSLILENSHNNDVHLLQTALVTFVDRGQNSHRIAFSNDENAILAKVQSAGELKLHPNDEIVFMDTNRDRKIYRLIDVGALANERYFAIDLADLQWFSGETITTVYFKNNTINTMYKYSLDANQASGLKKLATCFSTHLH